MKAATFGTKRLRSLASILGALALGTASLAVALFFFSGSAVSAAPWSAGLPNAVPSIPGRIRPPSGHITKSTSIEFAWNNLGVPTYTLRLDGQVYTLTATSYWTTLADGAHSWAVQAVNELGEKSGYDSNWTVTVDTIPPLKPTLLTPPDGTRTASPAIDFTWTGVGAAFYNLSLDGGAGGVYTTSSTSMLLVLSEGGHTWAVRAVDEAGNSYGYTNPRTVIVDLTPPPVPPLVSPEDDAAVNDAWVTFGWGDVGAPSYDLYVVGVDPFRDPYTITVASGTTTYSRSLLDGTYSWKVRSRDDVGNVSAYSNPWTLTVDTAPPSTPTMLAPPDGSLTRDPSVTFDWTAVAENGVTYDLWVDADPPVGPLSGDQHQLWLPNGTHNWKVRSVDAVGNQSNYSESWQVTVDTVSPTLTIASPLPGTVLTTTHLPTLTIRGTASDPGTGTGLDRVQVNVGGDWQSAQGTLNWSYDWVLPVVDEQTHNIRVRAWDQAGNSTVRSVLVTIDTQAPTTFDLVHNRGIYVNGPVVYSWSVFPDAAGIRDYRIRIENSLSFSLQVITGQSTYTFGGANDEGEEYHAWVQARDTQGNWGAWSASSPVVIPDLTPPEISYPEILVDSQFMHAQGSTLYYTNAMSVSQLVEITGISVDLVSRPVRVEFSQAFGDRPLDDTIFLDGRWSSAQPPHYGYHVDPGETASGQIVATVHDAAGNTTSQSFGYEPDSTPPESTADAPTYATGMPIFVDYDAFDTQSGVGPVQLYYRHAQSSGWQPAPAPGGVRTGESETFWFLPLHGDGLYEFAARAEDVLGNRETGAFVAQTSTIYDTTQPSSSVTWAPEFRRGDTITGTWEAVPSQAPITTVDLWVRPVNGVDPDAWMLAKVVGTGGSTVGEFTYDVIYDGVYYFATVAHDAAGKSEPEPQGSGDMHTIRDTEIGAPLDVTLVQSQDWLTDNDFEVVWTHPQDLSGIAAAIYQLYPESGVPLDPVHEYVNDPPRIEGIHVPAEGRYTLWLWLVDEAGNVGTPAPAAPQTVLKFDRTILRPTSLTVQPGKWSAVNDFDVSWVNPDDASGITGAYYKLGSPPFWAEDADAWVHGADLEQIDQLTVTNEGAHTLYLWLKDVAGNVDHRKWTSTTLRYDASPPEEVAVIAPSLAPSVLFEVEWGGSDYHSGIISYTVAVSGWPTYEWQPWLISTTQTSAFYHAPRADDWVDFRVTAYDRAGNSAQAEKRTRVDLQLVFLPFSFVRSRWLPWHQLDIYEQNNTEADAYGPLESLTVYDAAIWDETDPTDFYYFVPSVNDAVRVTLDGMASGVDLDLAIWVYSEADKKYQLVGWEPKYNNQREVINLAGLAGRKYWVEVMPDAILRSNHPQWKPNSYTLQVVYR